MFTTVAEMFVENLTAAGVRRICGIVGDSLNGLTGAIRRDGRIECGRMRHQEAAAFAAGAEAHLTGELAVCAGSCGRGNLRLPAPPAITLDMAKSFSLYMLKALFNGRGEHLVDLAKTNLWS